MGGQDHSGPVTGSEIIRRWHWDNWDVSLLDNSSPFGWQITHCPPLPHLPSLAVKPSWRGHSSPVQSIRRKDRKSKWRLELIKRLCLNLNYKNPHNTLSFLVTVVWLSGLTVDQKYFHFIHSERLVTTQCREGSLPPSLPPSLYMSDISILAIL